MEQTVTQWFNELTEPHKSQALANILVDRRDRMCHTMSDAIDKGMHWSDTPQGHEYWHLLRQVYLSAEGNGASTYAEAMKEYEAKMAEKLARMVMYSASMKEMLNKLADDCRVSRILSNEEWVNNSFCNYVTTRNGMLSYLPNGREHKVNPDNGRWLRDGRQEMKPAKLARKLMNDHVLTQCDDTDFEKFGNKVRAYLGIMGDEDGEGRNIMLSIIQGADIRWAYHGNNYSSALGGGTNLHSSCMRSGDAQEYFDIYIENPDKVQMLVAKDTEGKILGRALLWNFDDGDKGMDTVYGSDMIAQVFKDWAIDNDYWYKSNQSCHHSEFNVYNGEIFDQYALRDKGKIARRITLSNWDFEYYPYVDSVYYLCNEHGARYLSNSHAGAVDKTLRSTEGRYSEYDEDEDDDYVTLENGDRCHTDDACHLDYVAHDGDRICGWYHESELVYANRGEYMLTEHCTIVNREWYALDDDDIVYVEDRDAYCLSDDTVYCEVREITIHVDDAVLLADSTWCDRDEAFECAHDGEWYIKSERVIATDGALVYEGNLESYLEQIKEKENETERETTTA